MKKLAMTLVTVLIIASLPSYAFAYGPDPGRGHGGVDCYGPGRSVLSQLNLTPEQTAKINAIREANLRDMKPLKDKMFSKRGDLRLLWLQTNPDQNKIMAAQKDIRALRDQMQDKMTAYRLEVLKVLTPEQREKLKSFKMGYGGGHGMKGGPGMGGGPGQGNRGNW
ncbi:MAG: Spy/CpxP family protein refolding chaperone [Syntrophales bacterium]